MSFSNSKGDTLAASGHPRHSLALDLIRWAVKTIAVIAIILATVWGALALYYRLPAPALTRDLAAVVLTLLGIAAIISIVWRMHLVPILVFVLAFGALLIWWSTIKPPSEGDWARDVSRQVTGTVEGDTLTLTNVRNFSWNPDGSFEERWETRTYDLTKLRTLDLLMSYWAGPEMAHMILSFGFEGNNYLAWSIEVRRSAGGKFSPLADLFKTNPLVIIAADERDVVRVRSNVRGEDVQMYRMKVDPENARRLFLQYVVDANELAEQPMFYNSLTTNCTTTAAKMMHAVGAKFPFDWRLIVNGYLPEFAYQRKVLDMHLPFEQLKEAAHIDANARKAGAAADFSQAIRDGVPSPLE